MIFIYIIYYCFFIAVRHMIGNVQMINWGRKSTTNRIILTIFTLPVLPVVWIYDKVVPPSEGNECDPFLFGSILIETLSGLALFILIVIVPLYLIIMISYAAITGTLFN